MSKSKLKVILYLTIPIMVVVTYFRWDLYYSSGFEGYVLDSETYKPVAGALVKMTWQDYSGASYHGSSYFGNLINQEATTDKLGRFEMSGWLRMLDENRYYDKRSPYITIDHPDFQPYRVYTRYPYPKPWFGYVSHIPPDNCIANEDGNYYVDSIKKSEETVFHTFEEISGSLKSPTGNNLSGVRISIEWNALFDSCTNATQRKIAEFHTVTNEDGVFVATKLNIGMLDAGYKIPIDQPKIVIACEYKARHSEEFVFRSAKLQRVNSYPKYYPPGSIHVNWVKPDGTRTENQLTIGHENCLKASPSEAMKINTWVTYLTTPQKG